MEFYSLTFYDTCAQVCHVCTATDNNLIFTILFTVTPVSKYSDKSIM